VGARSPRASASTAGPSGRHFLSPRLAAELARDFEVGRDELVVEVGAGTGRLTRELARRARLVLAIEMDPGSAAHVLRASSSWPNVYVHRGDALHVGLPATGFRVVGNIPFGITTALLRRFTQEPHATRLDLITQYEAARKRARGLGSVLTVVWGATWRFDLRRRLPARSFHPPPSVDAAWLVAERRSRPLLDPAELEAFERFVRIGFRHPDAPIRRATGLHRGDVRTAGIGDRERAVDLSVPRWIALYRATVARRADRS
jgi:23S rRNA (adenine-N6)-dimethyltransferase